MTAGPAISGERLLDPDRLAAFLETVPDLRGSLPVRSVRRIGLGQSNVTFRVELTGRSVVVRRPPPGPLPPSAHDVLREYRVLVGLSGGTVPVPRPLAACDDPEAIGVPFYVMEDLPGDAIRYELPPNLGRPEARRSVGEQLVDALAALHETNQAAVGLDGLGKPAGYLARQMRRWRGQLDHARVRPVPDLDWAADWLDAALPPESPRASIVHGDYKLDNAIFSLEGPPRLLGVVDWEMATLGDPLADLGWLAAFWRQAGDAEPDLAVIPRVTEESGFPTRSELVERYLAQTGHALPDLRFYVVFSLWKMAVLLEGHWARHVRGTAGAFDFRYLERGGPAFAARIRRVAEVSSSGDVLDRLGDRMS